MAEQPLAYLGTFTSLTRNVFSLSSLAITMIGFANTFPESLSWIVKALGILIFVFSMVYAIKTTQAFQHYHDVIKAFLFRDLHDSDNKTESKLDKKLLADLQWHIYMMYLFVIIMTVVVILFASFKIEKWFPTIYGNTASYSRKT